MPLLAERPVLGYPGVSVELHVDGDNITVHVRDPFGGVMWAAKDRKDASDRYFHPFAYGYQAPEYE